MLHDFLKKKNNTEQYNAEQYFDTCTYIATSSRYIINYNSHSPGLGPSEQSRSILMPGGPAVVDGRVGSSKVYMISFSALIAA